jgi:hypothetical protein
MYLVRIDTYNVINSYNETEKEICGIYETYQDLINSLPDIYNESLKYFKTVRGDLNFSETTFTNPKYIEKKKNLTKVYFEEIEYSPKIYITNIQINTTKRWNTDSDSGNLGVNIHKLK